MSHDTYQNEWIQAQNEIADLMETEVPTKPKKPETDRASFFQLLATMYVKYIQSFKRLEDCYDQIVQPQKRRVLRHLLDSTMGRLLEIKNEMVEIEASEYHFYDDVLADLKVTPEDIEIPIPRYFLRERQKALKEREKLLGQILAKLGPPEKDDKDDIPMTEEEAICLIQMHERARQGRLRAKFMREIRQQEEREKKQDQKGQPSLDSEVAVIRIQKMWKGFATRRRAERERREEMIFIGMLPPPVGDPKKTSQALQEKVVQARQLTQENYEQEFQQALITIKDKLRETEGPDMKETLQDQIRQWFIEVRDATGKFPDYPAEDDGGSKAVLFVNKDPAELERELADKEENKGKKGSAKGKKGKKGSAKKGKKGKKDDKKKGKGKKDDDEDESFQLKESQFIPGVQEGTTVYQTVWSQRDESHNFSQKHDAELIREQMRDEVEDEIRLQVDELMRQELANLKLAVDRDKGKKGKKSGKKKKKKKSGKKGKKKGKKEKDLTPDRTIDDLYEELVTENIIQRCPKVRLHDYRGEYSYLATTLRQANIEPQPSLSDVRRLITAYGILPLGSEVVHEKAPLIKSILLAGPHGTGKKMLVHSICNEVGANFINLSAANIAGRYPGKDGLKMMLHIVLKVGRALQPSVIWMGDCEKMFKKKVPKSDPTDPKRLKKQMPKILKMMKAEERIVFIGTSSLPWDAEAKPFCKIWQKLILIPRPDYASRHLLWRHLIGTHGGIMPYNFDISSLAKVTDGYTMGHMVTACETILTERRIAQQAKKPLATTEFLAPLARIDPVYKEEEEAFKDWYQKKTPLGKKRAELAKGDDDDGGGKGGKGKKGKKDGKKSGKKGKKKK